MVKKASLPTEILSNIFSYLDGKSLVECKRTCAHWNNLITWYDDVVWPNACQFDFEKVNQYNRRFWSLQFPQPTSLISNQPTWQDMYRITFNWYHGYAKGAYAEPRSSPTSSSPRLACTVIGAPQEQGMFTTLTLSHEKQVVRSNPNYHLHQNKGSIMIQSPQTNQVSYLEIETPTHSVVCHYTHPSSNHLVTGALNGTVGVWNLATKAPVRMWQGHRGRVLCISMNEQVVVSGGSDNMIRVWDLNGSNTNWHRPARRGMIDISSYLSGTSEWYQGVGEIAVNGHLIACAPDASGPILIFSLLTGSLVYELRSHNLNNGEWVTEDITSFTRLCLTPFFLLTKGKVDNKATGPPLVPTHRNIALQRRELQETRASKKSMGYIAPSVSMPPSRMTPYQLYQYYQSIQHEEDQMQVPSSSACINVWDLQTGKIIHRLLPTLDNPYQNYTITDIRLSPDYSKVFASIEIRGAKQYEEKVFYWDFAVKNLDDDQPQNFDIMELDRVLETSATRKNGKSWVCLM